jgi:hypothetical protein
MGVGLALVAWSSLVANPTVSAPIRFDPGPPLPSAVFSPISVAWQGTSFQLVYSDFRTIRLNRVDVSGRLLDDTAVPVAGLAISLFNDEAVVTCGPGSCLAMDSQRNGVVVSQGAPTAAPMPLVAFSPQGKNVAQWDGAHFVLLWTDSAYDVLAARFATTGAPLDGPNGVMITDGTGFPVPGGIACLPGQCLLSWSLEGVPSSQQDLQLARISTDGGRLDAIPLKLAATPDDEAYPALATDGAQYLAAWSLAPVDGGNQQILVRAVNTQGNPQGTGPALIGAHLRVSDDLGPCVVFDGQRYLVIWTDALPPRLLAVHVSTSGVPLDNQPQLWATVPGNVAHAPRCSAGGGEVLVTFDASLTSAQNLSYGVFAHADGGVSGPVPLAIAAANQQTPALAGTAQGFKLLWTEWTPSASHIHGVDFGPGGLSADVDVAPFSSTATNDAVACEGAACIAVWNENRLGGGEQDTLSAGLLPAAGAPVAASSTIVVQPDAGLFPEELAVARSGNDWQVVTTTAFRQGIWGMLLDGNGQPQTALTQVDPVTFGNVNVFGRLALRRGGGDVWLSYYVDTDVNTYGELDVWRADQLGLPAATFNIDIPPGNAALVYAASGLLGVGEGVGDAGDATYFTRYDDAGTPAARWVAPLGGLIALAWDGQQQHLAVGTIDDGGATATLAALPLTADGQPQAAAVPVYTSAYLDPNVPITVAPLSPGAFAIAFTDKDDSPGVNANRVVLVLVSFSGAVNGSACSVAADCASFYCPIGRCQAAPDGGLTPADAGPAGDGGPGPDGGSSSPDGGALAPDSGSFPPDGGGILLPDGGLLLPDGGVVTPPPNVFHAGCGCAHTPAGGALLMLLWLGWTQRRARRRP